LFPYTTLFRSPSAPSGAPVGTCAKAMPVVKTSINAAVNSIGFLGIIVSRLVRPTLCPWTQERDVGPDRESLRGAGHGYGRRHHRLMLTASGLGDEHGRRHHGDAAEYEPFLVAKLSRFNASRFARRKRLRQRHPGNGKSDSGNNRAGLDSGFAHDPLRFWLYLRLYV